MSNVPVLRKVSERKSSIVRNTPAIFYIEDNSMANGAKPLIEISSKSEVGKWCHFIVVSSAKYKVDQELVKAVMYMETTHGWYDAIDPLRQTIRPMNVHSVYWAELGVSASALENPAYNIDMGVLLLRRIIDRLEKPTIEKIATLYNSLAKEKVTDYGARVANIYRRKPWLADGCK